MAFSSQPTRFVIVLDIGAGTNDMAAFDFDESVEPPSLSEIKEARQCSALAGDEVDRILIELMLRKAGFDRNNPDDMRTLRAARLTARELKKDIFRHGKCTMRVGRKIITVLAKELAEDPNFRTYQQALAQTIAASLRVVAQRAQAAGATTIDVVLAGGGSHLPFLIKSVDTKRLAISVEAADVVLMTDDLAKIVTARAIARRAYRTIQENLFVGVGVVHVCGITAALLGWIGPIQAAILHLGPDVLVFLNSVKLLHVRIEEA